MLRKIIGRTALLAGAAAGTYMAIRPWHTRWGATDEEVTMPLPGDDLVPATKQQATRAITIQAPPEDVWAWLVQIGQGRGGFYSYDALEQMIGADIHTADRIVPELQTLEVGDLIRLAPDPGPAMYVATVEPARMLVLYAGMDATGTRMYAPGETLPAEYSVATWAFVLEPIEEGGTRLIVRFRLDWTPSLVSFIVWRVMTEPAHFIMERKMLLSIKERAERTAAPEPKAARVPA